MSQDLTDDKSTLLQVKAWKSLPVPMLTYIYVAIEGH